MTDDNKAIDPALSLLVWDAPVTESLDPGLYLWLSGAPEAEVRKVMSAELFEELSAPLTPEIEAVVDQIFEVELATHDVAKVELAAHDFAKVETAAQELAKVETAVQQICMVETLVQQIAHITTKAGPAAKYRAELEVLKQRGPVPEE